MIFYSINFLWIDHNFGKYCIKLCTHLFFFVGGFYFIDKILLRKMLSSIWGKKSSRQIYITSFDSSSSVLAPPLSYVKHEFSAKQFIFFYFEEKKENFHEKSIDFPFKCFSQFEWSEKFASLIWTIRVFFANFNNLSWNLCVFFGSQQQQQTK